MDKYSAKYWTEQALLDAITEEHQEANRYAASNGIWPDWKGEKKDIAKDKGRLLNHLYEHGCIVWNNGPSQNKIKIAEIIGYKAKSRADSHNLFNGTDDPVIAVTNAKALIDECHREGLISTRIYDGDIIYELESFGEILLEEYLDEQSLNNEDPLEGYMRYDEDE
jgi:hypothetical protein